MQFGNPYAFLLLGVVPILLLIHSLRPKPRQIQVTNLFLWRDALKERGGGARIRRILRNLPLILQILAVLAAATALADPSLAKRSLLEGDVILVMDTSASMKSGGPGASRLEKARKSALELIQNLPSERKMMILEAGRNPILRTPFTSDHGLLRKLVESIDATDAPGDPERALYMALSFMNPDKNDTVFFITDGAGMDFQKLSGLHPKLKTILVSGGERNVGITKFEFRQRLDAGDRYEILLELKNCGPEPLLCPLRLLLDGKPLVSRTIGLKGGEKKLLIFPYSGLIAGVAEAELDIKDDLETDNRAFSVLSTSRDIWVLLVSRGNFFLEKLLEAYPNVKVNVTKEVVGSSWSEQIHRHDIVILDRVPHPSLERGNYLLIQSLSPSIPVMKLGQVRAPSVLTWDSESPLMRGLDLAGLRIESAWKVRAKEPVETILEAEETGLIFTYEKDGIRALFVGFDLTRSDLPLRVAFPVMMSNLLNWLDPNKLRFSSHQVQTGTPYPIYLDSATAEFTVRLPGGETRMLRAVENPHLFSDTDRAGLYLVTEGEHRRYFAANLVDPGESDIRVPRIQRRDDAERPSKPVIVQARRFLWPLLLLLVCALLGMEWVIWCRGSD